MSQSSTERPRTSREFLRQPPVEGQVLDGLLREAVKIFWAQTTPGDRGRPRKLYAWEAAEKAIDNSGLKPGSLLDEIGPDLTVTPDDVAFRTHGHHFYGKTSWPASLAKIAFDAVQIQLRRFPDIRDAHRKREERAF